MCNIRLISNNELTGLAKAGNGFSKLEHAEAVAKNIQGSEAIVKKDNLYYLYDSNLIKNPKELTKNPNMQVIEFVDKNNQVFNIQNSEGIKGVGDKVSNNDLKGKASAGNVFSKYSDAESVAKNLNFDTAIVTKDNKYFLYKMTNEGTQKILNGDNSLIDGKVSSVIKSGKTLYNWSYESPAKTPNNQSIAYSQNGKIMVNDKEFKMSGINVYDLAAVANDQKELEKTLKLISDSGANTVRFMALSSYPKENYAKILDTSKNMGLDLKFVVTFGNHWQHCEKPEEAKVKDDNWYKNDYKKNYLPHVKESVQSLMTKDNLLMLELMNEPDAQHDNLKTFADDVSSQIRELYNDYDKQHNSNIPRHLISLGTDAMAIGVAGYEKSYAKGLQGHDYKDIYGLPNIDVVTAHDYTYDKSYVTTPTDLSNTFKQHIKHAKELNKPFFLGEIGIKTNKDRAPDGAMNIMKERLELYKKENISGALLWGPQPNGHAVDGDGFGFNFSSPEKLKDVFDKLK
ncbi:MAG: cellulase family glycosylhydrolase [Candidatus Sericytochromatia bacterium]